MLLRLPIPPCPVSLLLPALVQLWALPSFPSSENSVYFYSQCFRLLKENRPAITQGPSDSLLNEVKIFHCVAQFSFLLRFAGLQFVKQFHS